MHPTTDITNAIFGQFIQKQEADRQRQLTLEASPRIRRLKAIFTAARQPLDRDITGHGFNGFAEVMEMVGHPGAARAARAKILMAEYKCRHMGWGGRSQMGDLPALRREEKRRTYLWRSYQNLNAVDHALSLIKEPLQ